MVDNAAVIERRMKVQVLYLKELDYLGFVEIADKITRIGRGVVNKELVHRELDDFLSSHGLDEIVGEDLRFCLLVLKWPTLTLLTVERVSETYCVVAVLCPANK